MATAKCSSLLRFLVCIFIFKDAISHSDLQFNDDLVVKLIDKVESMQVKTDNLEKNNRDLKQSVSTLIGTTAKFRIQIEELTDRLTEYEKLDAEKSVRIKGLENMLNALTEPDKIIGKEREIEHEADTENDNDESIKDDNRYMIRKEKRQTPDNVAFTAYLDHVIRNLGTDQPVVYNQILLNDGGAYSDKTGIFFIVM
ncbi:uncharacterized protein LOC123562545 [Mercenaria mercenaria]|uniref:uncharacterized protein LOC123562545 n=1 Tax=Mercenaria mercenaria TaxID=6596 RepID=UPI00234EF856|nr:uncharacterized protein LOC123562545 [Mercenaria mercenaria]